jgi:acyl carrier protein
MDTKTELRGIFRDVLQLGPRADSLEPSSRLLGGIPEFDSMAVVSLVTAIEEHFECEFHDDEITQETFETFGSLVEVLETKLSS